MFEKKLKKLVRNFFIPDIFFIFVIDKNKNNYDN